VAALVVLLLVLVSLAGHVLLAAGRAQNTPQLTAGDTEHGVWCVPCSAPVAVRVPLRYGDSVAQVSYLTVCASCGTRQIPAVPVATLTRPRWRRPRPWVAVLWWLHRRDSARRGRTGVACAIRGCDRPGWWDCAWYEAVDDGRIRWMFCGHRHRREWLQATQPDSGLMYARG
jgi:hypothetical protein